VGDNLISVHGVDHSAVNNHVAVSTQAWRRLGGIVSLHPLEAVTVGQSAGRQSAVTCSDKMMAASQSGDEGHGFMGYRRKTDVDVNDLFTIRS